MKIVMVKAYAHLGLTNMERREMGTWDLAVVKSEVDHPSLGHCWVGHFILGIGAFNVHFPKGSARPATADERQRYCAERFYRSFAPSFKLVESDFALSCTSEELIPRAPAPFPAPVELEGRGDVPRP